MIAPKNPINLEKIRQFGFATMKNILNNIFHSGNSSRLELSLMENYYYTKWDEIVD